MGDGDLLRVVVVLSSFWRENHHKEPLLSLNSQLSAFVDEFEGSEKYLLSMIYVNESNSSFSTLFDVG